MLSCSIFATSDGSHVGEFAVSAYRGVVCAMLILEYTLRGRVAESVQESVALRRVAPAGDWKASFVLREAARKDVEGPD